MAGNPKTPKSKSELGSAAGYKRMAASTKGVRVGVNNTAAKPNVATIRPVKGGLVGKTAPLAKKSMTLKKKK
jgi:hypothetical protein